MGGVELTGIYKRCSFKVAILNIARDVHFGIGDSGSLPLERVGVSPCIYMYTCTYLLDDTCGCYYRLCL